MLLPMKRVLVEYNILVVKMVANNATIDNAKVNYEFLCDLKILDLVWFVLPPLKTMQRMSKFAQGIITKCECNHYYKTWVQFISPYSLN